MPDIIFRHCAQGDDDVVFLLNKKISSDVELISTLLLRLIAEHPANEFIAGFVGYVNFLEGTIDTIDKEARTLAVSTDFGKLEITLQQDDIKAGDEVLLVIRPETVSVSSLQGTEGLNTFHGTVESHMYAGSLAKYTVNLGHRKMIIDQYNPRDSRLFKEKDKVAVTIPANIHVLKKGTASALPT